MAQLAILGGNLKSLVAGKVKSNKKKNACQKFCDYFPFLVCPCSFEALEKLLSGNFHTFVLSLFACVGVGGLIYSRFFGWNSTLMDIMIAIAFVGPLWVACTIAPKVQLAGVKTGVMGEIDTLQHTNATLRKKLSKYRQNIVTLKKATDVMTTQSKVQRVNVKKSTGISNKLQKEDRAIHDHIYTFREKVGDIEDRRKTLPIMINEFEERVSKYLDAQPDLEDADVRIMESQKDTEGVVTELKYFPERLGEGVKSIEYIQEWYLSAGTCAKEVSPLLEQMREEYNRFADLIRLQELSFMRKLAYDINKMNDDSGFTNEEYNLFVDRLPSYLADVVIRDRLKFKKYASRGVGLARHMGSSGVKKLVEDIVDGVSKVDQTSAIFLMPDAGALADQSALMAAPLAKKKKLRRGRSSFRRGTSSKNA